LFKGWTGWIARSLCRVLIISVLTVMLTWNMVEMYMNRWIAELGLADEVSRAQFKDWLLHLGGVEDRSLAGETPFERLTDRREQQPLLPVGSEKADATAEASDEAGLTGSKPGEAGQEEGGQPDAVPVFGYLLEEDLARGDGLVMSSDELASWQDSMSEEDKLTIFTTVMAKLPQDEYQNLSYLLEAGLTAEETVQIYEILGRYLTDEEMIEIVNILHKYE